MFNSCCCDAVVAWPSQIGRKRREYRSVGKQLGLGIDAHHVDGRGPRDRPSLHGPPTAEYPDSNGNPESSNKVTPGTHRLNCPDHCSRFASSRSTRDRSWAVGGSILVAWRSRIAFRGNSLLCRFNVYARRFGADAGTPLAYDGRVGSNGRNAIVWHKHCLHLRGDARMLADYDPAPPALRDAKFSKGGARLLPGPHRQGTSSGDRGASITTHYGRIARHRRLLGRSRGKRRVRCAKRLW